MAGSDPSPHEKVALSPISPSFFVFMTYGLTCSPVSGPLPCLSNKQFSSTLTRKLPYITLPSLDFSNLELISFS